MIVQSTTIDLHWTIPGLDVYGIPDEFKSKDAYIAFFKYGIHRSILQSLRSSSGYAPVYSKKNSIEGSSFTNYFERFLPLSLTVEQAGNIDLRDNAEETATVNDVVTAGYFGKAVKKTDTVKSKVISRYGSAQNYVAHLRYAMADWWRHIVDLMCAIAFAGGNIAATPLYNAQRVGEMPFASRALVGNYYKEYHYDDALTLNQVIHEIVGDDVNANSKMSVKHIRSLRRMATSPLYNAPRIEPVKTSIQTLSYIDTYYLFMDDAASAALMEDEDYVKLYLNKPFYENGLPSALNNADYLGRINDIECYHLPILDEVKNLGMAGNAMFNRFGLHDNISHSFLVGASALGEIIGAYKELTAGNDVTQEWADRYNYGMKFIYGAKALTYPFVTTEKIYTKRVESNKSIRTTKRRLEQGIIHSFTVNEGGNNWHRGGSFEIPAVE